MTRNAQKKKGTLTRREREALELVSKEGSEGYGVWELAKTREISYPAAYTLLERLKEKGYLREEWEKKGNKKKFFPTSEK